MKMNQSFTLASVGDLILIRPASQFKDPGFQSAIKIIHDADLGFGNFESIVRDERNFIGPVGGMIMNTTKTLIVTQEQLDALDMTALRDTRRSAHNATAIRIIVERIY